MATVQNIGYYAKYRLELGNGRILNSDGSSVVDSNDFPTDAGTIRFIYADGSTFTGTWPGVGGGGGGISEYLGIYPNEAGLPVATAGQFAYVEDTNTFWIYNAVWEDTGQTGQLQIAIVAADPGSPVVDSAWYNSTDKRIRLETTLGTETVAFRSDIPENPFNIKDYAFDASANPNYPAADAGDYYIVSVGGKIGGGAGTDVVPGDVFYCKIDGSLAGTQAAVGANWVVQNYTVNASAVVNVPAGNIAAVTVQAAINELDTEKANTALSNVSGTLAVANGGTGATSLPTPSNYTPSAATVSGHLDGIDTALGGVAASIAIKDEGSAQGSAATLDFVGAGVSASVALGVATVTISGGSNTFADNVFRIQDDGDATKQLAFEVSGVTTATTRTLTVPNASGTIALTSDIPAVGVTVEDENVSQGTATTLNFTGAGVSATVSGGEATITIAGGGGGGDFYTFSGNAVDWANGSKQKQATSGSLTLSFSNPAAGGEYTLLFTASGGALTVNFPSGHITPGQTAAVVIPSTYSWRARADYTGAAYYWSFGELIKAI